jgi:hypothetical protein
MMILVQPERNAQCASTSNCSEAFAGPSLVAMKNIYEVLRSKEMDLVRLRTQVDALRLVAPLLADQITEPSNVDGLRQLEPVWTPPLQKNKWPLKVSHPGPTYFDS